MKTLISLLAIAFAATAGTAYAATAQQEKMKNCNAEAKTKDLKGDERKAFMKECLSAKSEAAPAPAAADKKTTQQEKMKACNADPKAKELKGADRKKFMSECLKG